VIFSRNRLELASVSLVFMGYQAQDRIGCWSPLTARRPLLALLVALIVGTLAFSQVEALSPAHLNPHHNSNDCAICQAGHARIVTAPAPPLLHPPIFAIAAAPSAQEQPAPRPPSRPLQSRGPPPADGYLGNS
jgi:hypothetical protein